MCARTEVLESRLSLAEGAAIALFVMFPDARAASIKPRKDAGSARTRQYGRD
jgi:hypothetical protein